MNGIREENTLFTNIITELKKCATVQDCGSSDILEQFIDEHDLPIKVVIYRAGANPPRFLYDSKM